MLPTAAPQWTRCARHLSEGLVYLHKRSCSCRYEITDVNFIFFKHGCCVGPFKAVERHWMDDQLRCRDREQPTGEVGLGYDEFAKQTRPSCSGSYWGNGKWSFKKNIEVAQFKTEQEPQQYQLMGVLKLCSLTTRCRGWQSSPLQLYEAATVEI